MAKIIITKAWSGDATIVKISKANGDELLFLTYDEWQVFKRAIESSKGYEEVEVA